MSSFARKYPRLGRAASAVTGLFRDRNGASAAEMAMLLPVLLTIIIGTIEFGRSLQVWNETSQAVGKAVRVVNIDSDTTTTQVETLISDYLAQVNTSVLSVQATKTTVSGTQYMNIAVNFPFEVSIPFWTVTTLALQVKTKAPIMSALK